MTQLDLTVLPPPRAETMFPDADPEPVETEQRDDLPVPAGGLTCVLSYLTDLACIVAVADPLQQLPYPPVLTGIAIVELIAVLTLLRARTGHIPGALLSETVAIADGSDHVPGLKRQLVRTTLIILLHVTVVGPLIVSFLSRDGRDLIDRVTGTTMLNLRSEKPRPGSGDGDEETEGPLPRGRESSSFPVPGAPISPSPPAPAANPLTSHRAASREPAPAAPPGNTQTDPLTPRRAASPPPTPPKPSPAPTTGPTGLPDTVRAQLIMDSGQREKVDSVLIVRREPTGTSGERRLVIPDPTDSISRIHLRLGPASGGVQVEDAASTNRTVVHNAASAVAHLARGRRTLLPPGTTITMEEHTMMIMSGSPR